MKNSELDVWDYLFIRNCKRKNGPSLNILRRIVGKRSGINFEYTERMYVLERLLEIVQFLDLTTLEKFVHETNETNNKYRHQVDGTNDHYARCINYCCGLLRLCKVTGVEKMKNYPTPLHFKNFIKRG